MAMSSCQNGGRANVLLAVCLAIAICSQPTTSKADSIFALTATDSFRIPSDRPMRECAIERECTELEGSCIANAECDGSLVCGLNNCVANATTTFSGEPMEFNCCVHECDFRGDMFAGGANSDCCTERSPCGANQGDCDNDDQCGSGLICGSNNCPWGGSDDCCAPAPLTPIVEVTCSRDNQCGENEGDCDADTDCESDLVCGANNCGLVPSVLLGSKSSADCCVRPCGYSSPYLGTPFHPATDCCHRHAPCNVGEGNCNAHDECSDDSVCLAGTCPWGGGGKCCAPKCENALTGGQCCTDDRPCGIYEGECEQDTQCQDGLSCSGSCPWGSGLCCAATPIISLPPTLVPTMKPNLMPTTSPSTSIGGEPTATPTITSSPTSDRGLSPIELPSASPTATPTGTPANSSTLIPSTSPTQIPTKEPTLIPTYGPSQSPSQSPTEEPTLIPTYGPSQSPSQSPTEEPTLIPTYGPSQSPTEEPTLIPTYGPSQSPTEEPTLIPTYGPSQSPTTNPTKQPSSFITAQPTAPTWSPSSSPTMTPTTSPSSEVCSTVVAQATACKGCRKDYFIGMYVFCNGIVSGGAVDYCAFFGGAGDCTFPKQQDLTIDECEQLCAEEFGCQHFSWVEGKSCRLHLMDDCNEIKSSKSTLAVFDAEQCYIGPDVVIDENNTTNSTQPPTSSQPDECRASEVAIGFTCEGCQKDIASGQYIGCDGASDVNATKTNCDEFGGPNECTFVAQTEVGPETCEAMCREELGCTHYTSWDSGECVLHLTRECNVLTETSSPLVLLMEMSASSACDESGGEDVGIGFGIGNDDDEDVPPLRRLRDINDSV